MSILKGDPKDIVKNSTWRYVRSGSHEYSSVFIVKWFDGYSVIFHRINSRDSITYSVGDFLRDFIPEDTLYEKETSPLRVLLVRLKASGIPIQELHELLFKLEI